MFAHAAYYIFLLEIQLVCKYAKGLKKCMTV